LELLTADDFPQTFDFRSKQFGDDAGALMCASGCAHDLCRQELFIAEGNYEEALAVLIGAGQAAPQGSTLH